MPAWPERYLNNRLGMHGSILWQRLYNVHLAGSPRDQVVFFPICPPSTVSNFLLSCSRRLHFMLLAPVIWLFLMYSEKKITKTTNEKEFISTVLKSNLVPNNTCKPSFAWSTVTLTRPITFCLLWCQNILYWCQSILPNCVSAQFLWERVEG